LHLPSTAASHEPENNEKQDRANRRLDDGVFATLGEELPRPPLQKLKPKSRKHPTPGGATYVQPGRMTWASTQFDKVSIKVLYENKAKGEMTCLLRLDSGAQLPMHVHTASRYIPALQRLRFTPSQEGLSRFACQEGAPVRKPGTGRYNVALRLLMTLAGKSDRGATGWAS